MGAKAPTLARAGRVTVVFEQPPATTAPDGAPVVLEWFPAETVADRWVHVLADPPPHRRRAAPARPRRALLLDRYEA